MFYNLNRWVCVRIDVIGGGFSAGLAAYLVYGRGAHEAANIGFSLNMAVGFSSMILWWVRILNEVEVSGNSLERIDSYIKIEQEPKPTEGGQPPAYWPASGDLRVENLSARYSSDGPKVLQDLSFHIKSGERVGIVGRTGSGKSSLTLSLLRCIFTEGNVYYDGIPTSGINLNALRSNVTIIPQIPELLSGTLRQNLDLFDQHDDAVLYDALRAAGLFSVQDESEEARLTLDSVIASGGGNLSVGQRQILALARAMVRGSKLLILDEATSAIDYRTDSAIQSSLRNELNNVTQIIVAHRLQTIIDADKIMVLDAGKLIEFGSPLELLQNEQGMLRALVDESGDKEALYAAAHGKPLEEVEKL
jgi:ABC-type multidrug transport system fused ATPase/permease subunit